VTAADVLFAAAYNYEKTEIQVAAACGLVKKEVRLRRLMESRPFLSRIPDQSLMADVISSDVGNSGFGPGPAGRDSDRIQVTRDGSLGEKNATYIMAYLPIVRDLRLNTSVIAGQKLSFCGTTRGMDLLIRLASSTTKVNSLQAGTIVFGKPSRTGLGARCG